MSEFVLRNKTLDISLIRAIEDDDDEDNEYLKEVLTRRDIDVNALGKNTWNNMPTTAIIMATNTKNHDKVRLLLETGRVRNINEADGMGRSPLFVASENGNYEIAKILLEHGADATLPPKKYPDWSGIQSKTPLDVAKNNKMRELLKKSSGSGVKLRKSTGSGVKIRKSRKIKSRKNNSKK
jgi:ankyrin repeat protein